MSEFKSKINNSYESSSSGSASTNSVNDPLMSRSMNFDIDGNSLSNLLVPSGEDYELYNLSAEEGIFPNVHHNIISNINDNHMAAPSYVPEYDYYNEYSTAPLVYSFMPIVPGFSQDGHDNLHNFEHVVKRQEPRKLDISVEEQHLKYQDSLVIHNKSDTRLYNILNNSNGMTFNHQLDDSCNAMDLDISCQKETININLELSFNGKIVELTSSMDEHNLKLTEVDNQNDFSPQFEVINESFESENVNQQQQQQDNNKELQKQPEEINNLSNNNEIINNETKEPVNNDTIEEVCRDNNAVNDEEEESLEEDRIKKNDSYELLARNEDSTKMMYLNEKSPYVENCDIEDDSDEQQQQTDASETDEKSPKITEVIIEKEIEKIEKKSLKDCDDFIFNKLQSSLSELRPPPSITSLPLSLSEMLTLYKKNSNQNNESSTSELKSNSLFVPSHPFNEVIKKEWPQLAEVKCHGISYNRSTDCEEIELMCLKFTDKFIRAETSTSFNHKCGPTSAKKKIEKLKLLAQSPGSRLSHLANRRKVFSSANLKSTSTSTSQKSVSGFMMIDKSKLYQKKKRTSAKKKTPGKRKTPKSAKKIHQLEIAKQSTASSVASSSRRVLFSSPMGSSRSTSNLLNASCENEMIKRRPFPKRTLFSPTQKRRRSPSPNCENAENRFGSKNRRLESPSKLSKSRSFSIAAPSSSGSLDEHFRKTLYYRTQSEMVLNQLNERSKSNLGFKKPMSEIEKKKLLWCASSALQSKQINRNHEKFKDHMSTLCRLVKKIFSEFYNSSRSMSAQMTKFSNMMVFYVVQGREFDEIYSMTKKKLEEQNVTKISGYIAHEDYMKNQFIRKNTSLHMISSVSCSTLNMSNDSDSLNESNFDRSGGSDTSLNRSTSKSNQNLVLRENFISQSRENSAKKQQAFSNSDPNLLKMSTSTPSSNILKAKRQISF